MNKPESRGQTTIIDREETLYYSQNDAVVLIDLLDNPPKPNAALTRAFYRFKQREIENGNQNNAVGIDA